MKSVWTIYFIAACFLGFMWAERTWGQQPPPAPANVAPATVEFTNLVEPCADGSIHQFRLNEKPFMTMYCLKGKWTPLQLQGDAKGKNPAPSVPAPVATPAPTPTP